MLLMKEGEKMTIQARKEREKQHIRTLIYDAAVDIMVTEGFESLSIRKIAKKIDYSPTLIYNYYENKGDILHQIFLNIYQEVMLEVVPQVESNHMLKFDVQFQILVSTFVEAILKHAEIFKLILQSNYNLFLADKNEAVYQVKRFLRHGKDAGEFNDMNESTAELIIITLIGLVSTILNTDIMEKEQQDKLIVDYCELLMKGIRKD